MNSGYNQPRQNTVKHGKSALPIRYFNSVFDSTELIAGRIPKSLAQTYLIQIF
jgi:hypothetical protein